MLWVWGNFFIGIFRWHGGVSISLFLALLGRLWLALDCFSWLHQGGFIIRKLRLAWIVGFYKVAAFCLYRLRFSRFRWVLVARFSLVGEGTSEFCYVGFC